MKVCELRVFNVPPPSMPSERRTLQAGQRTQIADIREFEQLVRNEPFVIQTEIAKGIAAIYRKGEGDVKVPTGLRLKPLEGDQSDGATFEIISS